MFLLSILAAAVATYLIVRVGVDLVRAGRSRALTIIALFSYFMVLVIIWASAFNLLP